MLLGPAKVHVFLETPGNLRKPPETPSIMCRKPRLLRTFDGSL
jgi:hypothetical protein